MTTPKGTYNDSLTVPVQQHGPLQDITYSPQHLKIAKEMDIKHCPPDAAQKTGEKSKKAREMKDMVSLYGCQVTINMQLNCGDQNSLLLQFCVLDYLLLAGGLPALVPPQWLLHNSYSTTARKRQCGL